MAEAVQICMMVTAVKDLAAFAKMQKNDLWAHHFGYGMWIRNNFSLGSEGLNLWGHPDDISMQVMEALVEFLQKNPNWQEMRRRWKAEDKKRRQEKSDKGE